MKVQIPPWRPVSPSPAALVTSVDAAGRPNLITLGEAFNLSIGMGGHAVIVGIAIAPARYSHQLVREAGEFVLNLPTAGLVEKVDRCGTTSGTVTDKFAEFGLTPLPAQKVRPPLVAECPLNLECRVVGMHSIGDHDLFMGEVLVEHVDADCLDAEGRIDPARLDPLCYVHGQYFRLGERLGQHGFTRLVKSSE